MSHILFLSAWYPVRHDPMPGLFVKKHAATAATRYKVSALHACAEEGLSVTEIDNSVIDQVNTVIVYYPKVTSSIPIFKEVLKGIRFIAESFLRRIC